MPLLLYTPHIAHLNKVLAGLVHLSDHEHFRTVTMVALVEHGHVHVKKHAFFQNSAVGDAVADNLVDARAATIY